MTQTDVKSNPHHTLKSWLRSEALIAPVAPMVAILIIGVLAISNIPSNIFIGSFLASAIIIFYIERIFFVNMQNEIQEKFATITTGCQAFLAGNEDIRIQLTGDEKTIALASTINLLLDKYKNHLEKNYAAQQEEFHQLQNQVRQLAYELKPVMDGNLRVKSTLQVGSIGAIANVCNALIEDLAKLIQWTQYMASEVIHTSRSQLSHSQEWAQTTEILKSRLSTMTETVEKLVAFILRSDSTLQSSIDITREMLVYIQDKKEVVNQEIPDTDSKTNDERKNFSDQNEEQQFLDRLTVATQRQVKLLDEVLLSVHDAAEIAEPLLGELYAFAQQFHHASTSVIKAAEENSSLAMLADNWSHAAQAFSVPENVIQDDLFIDDDMLQDSDSYDIDATTNI